MLAKKTIYTAIAAITISCHALASASLETIVKQVAPSVVNLTVEKNIQEVPGNPTAYIGYLIILGIGLGSHIEKLVKKTGPRHIIISEPVGEFVTRPQHEDNSPVPA